MTIKIDKGVPMPSRRNKYPWDKLHEHGDSFFIPGKITVELGHIAKVARRRGFEVIARTVTENGVQGVRVWRINDVEE